MNKYLFYISQDYSFAILRPLQEILVARGDEVKWFFEGNKVTKSYLTKNEILIDTVVDIFKYQPDVVVAPANSIPSFLPGLKVAVFHGFDAGKLDNRGNNDHFKIRGCFDLYCTQGPSTTSKFKELQQKHKFFNVIETGWPTLDKLFKTVDDTNKNKQPTIFLGSTFSKRLTQAMYIFPQVKELCETMDWKWIVSLHPKSDPNVIEMYRSIENKNLSYVATDDLLPILQEADIMVGDTSSSLTMFIVQNKPAVTVKNIDAKPYLLNIADANDLKSALEKALSYPDELMQKISDYNEETHPYRDGDSSKRVIKAIDDVLAGKYPLIKSKPFNLLKNLKFRKRLSYWRL
ncbi:polysialyltransferase family glycosyltransferase [Pseudoalteromonas denitrificans]|uniref:CDP-glycerol glycerophosphotransferase, TagB/SpsB family n=1 Tax=Pseudoalteromonas denitrificans DSM 6059 TaxID=1123010 RepID=A0A1I1M1D9_9GAMM|nr:polysialyltransferase family glycosyltransferase [Pseudoalteromonas denitrificans]SFC79194.1 CDP-glycerol glycerophosphotransferase, TagB/SpsB family [Pseudoalteromonas denitrificans DSM 6059]